MTLPHPLPEPLVEQLARRFRVIGEPSRIRLLDRLCAGEATVQELADALATTQQNASKHLSILHADGIVSRRRDGTRVFYAIADESVLELCESACGGLRRRVQDLSRVVGAA